MQTTEEYIQQLQCVIKKWKEKTKELQELAESLEKELKNEPKASGRWIPKEGENYFLISSLCEVTEAIFNKELSYEWDIVKHNAYKTREIADRMKAYYLALEEARWYPTENEWKNEELDKWCMSYDFNLDCMKIEHTRDTMIPHNPCFRTRQKCVDFYTRWQAEALIDWGIKNEL